MVVIPFVHLQSSGVSVNGICLSRLHIFANIMANVSIEVNIADQYQTAPLSLIWVYTFYGEVS